MTEIRRLVDCEFAPNILYEVVENKTDYYQYIKVGGLIRGPNCNPSSIVGAYWENYGEENEKFISIIRNMSEQDWKSKILVKYDKEKVYKTLYNNAKGGYEHFLSIANGYEKQMKEYEDVLNNL